MCDDNGKKVGGGVRFNLIRREYGERVKAGGGLPIYLDPNIDAQKAAQLCDGIIISGGEDIDPKLYGGQSVKGQMLEPLDRTIWEFELIDACDKKGIPILGICYGEQLLNVHYGGTLSEEVHKDYGSSIAHAGPRRGSNVMPTDHEVTFKHRFLGFDPGESLVVTSRHHQAIRKLAPGFKVTAQTSDGVIEAIAGHGHYGVQWHAESDASAVQIYGEFIKKCTSIYLPKAWAKSWQRVRTSGRAALLESLKTKPLKEIK